MNRIKTEIYFWCEALFRNLPGYIGVFLRRLSYKFWLAKLDSNFKIGMFSKIQQPQSVYIGKNVIFNDFAWITANSIRGLVFIGVMIQ